MNPERLMQIILAPVISEKSTLVGDLHNQVPFRVLASATKPEIKAAAELMFGKKVMAVNVTNVKGKAKRHGRFQGRRRDWKKAYVCFEPGTEINFIGTEA
ncbi:MAG: 50S ribosomal protein L23 [Burkholderiales bacterium]